MTYFQFFLPALLLLNPVPALAVVTDEVRTRFSGHQSDDEADSGSTLESERLISCKKSISDSVGNDSGLPTIVVDEHVLCWMETVDADIRRQWKEEQVCYLHSFDR